MKQVKKKCNEKLVPRKELIQVKINFNNLSLHDQGTLVVINSKALSILPA